MNMLFKKKIVLVALIALSSNHGLCGNTEIFFQSKQTQDCIIYSCEDVEQKPEFIMYRDRYRDMTSCEGLRRFIRWNLRYPVEAVKERVEGTVRVEFIINTDGTVADAKVVYSAHHLLNTEALRVINRSPKWAPGRHQGQPVRVKCTVWVGFRLI